MITPAGITGISSAAAGLLIRTEERRLEAGGRLTTATQRQLGQFFTPRDVAERIAAQPRLDHNGALSILDPGAGAGVLAAALVARVLRERPDLRISITAVEVDESLHEHLRETLSDCERTAAAVGVELDFEIVSADFIAWGVARALGSLDAPLDWQDFDIVIQNPPYGKLQRTSPVRHNLAMMGVDVPNLYAAFLAVGTRLLTSGGQLVAITPRSFCNGVYFRSFRRDLLRGFGLNRICVFHKRDSLFADSFVLQETVIFSGTRGVLADRVVIASASGYLDMPHERIIQYGEVVRPDDPEMFLRIPTDVDDDTISDVVSKLPATLADLRLQVSTGRVVDFRATEYLRVRPEHSTVPLIYPHHFCDGRVLWPSESSRKPNAIVRTAESEKLLLPEGTYVLVKRLSSKEEERRVVPCVYRPEEVPASAVGFENHLNVFHSSHRGIDPCLAVGLTAWLNSSTLDLYFRQFSGHTQVNATDLRNMRYPDRESLIQLGHAVNVEEWPQQDEIDKLVEKHILEKSSELLGWNDVSDPAAQKIDEARELLKELNFDAERGNERSGLVLLALAQLRPNQPWSDATNPLLRTVEVMDFLRQHYGRDYKPNTRETIRRQTLHQFAEAGLVVQNPDQPDRPTNSPRSCYQLTERATNVVRQLQTADFGASLREYLVDLPGLRERYAAERQMIRIPVTLPGGNTLKFSPGGQNKLIYDIVDKFCPYFTPGGEVLYIGDADDKWQHVETEALARLGLVFDDHGKMPDMVVYFRRENWLVLLEAASSHGPVDAKRHGELQALFAGSTVGLVFVSCFPTRAEMRKYLKDIAWETEVWCADAPTHLIHFNGERFLGPYTT